MQEAKKPMHELHSPPLCLLSQIHNQLDTKKVENKLFRQCRNRTLLVEYIYCDIPKKPSMAEKDYCEHFEPVT